VTLSSPQFQTLLADLHPRRLDGSELTPMNAGNFIFMPKTMRHFALCNGETVLQVHGIGPFKIIWLNPAEVLPTRAAPTAKP
jgi:hypothetical protein